MTQQQQQQELGILGVGLPIVNCHGIVTIFVPSFGSILFLPDTRICGYNYKSKKRQTAKNSPWRLRRPARLHLSEHWGSADILKASSLLASLYVVALPTHPQEELTLTLIWSFHCSWTPKCGCTLHNHIEDSHDSLSEDVKLRLNLTFVQSIQRLAVTTWHLLFNLVTQSHNQWQCMSSTN